jgi:PAS domain S-box-containing protein
MLVPTVRTELGVGATREARAAADAIREEIGVMAGDGSLRKIMSAWSYDSGQELNSLVALQQAKDRLRWYRIGLASVAALFLFASLSAAGYRQHRIKAQAYGQALAQAERTVRLVADSLSEMVVAYDTHRNLTYANSGAEKLTGYALAELQAAAPLSWTHPEDRPQVRALWDKVFDGKKVDQVVYRVITKDGKVKWVAGSWGPVTDEAERLAGIRGTCQDITERVVAEQLLEETTQRFRTITEEIAERRRAEAALRESEERFRSVADTAPVLIWASGPDKLCTFFNKVWLDFRGRTMEQELGNGWAEGVHPDDLDRCLATYFSSFDVRARLQMEYRLRRGDGEYRWVLDMGNPRYQGGEFAGYIGSCIDLTDQKLAQDRLRTSERRLIEAQRLAKVGSWERYFEGDAIYCSDEMFRIFGLPIGTPLHFQAFLSCVHPKDQRKIMEANRKARSSRAPEIVEYRITRPDGEMRFIRSFVEVLGSDDPNTPIRMSGATQDITDQVKAREQLRESEERLALAQTAAHLGTWERDLRTNMITISREYATLYGLAPDRAALTYEEWLSLIHPDERDALQTYIEESIKRTGSWDTEFRVVWPDGSEHWLLGKGRVLRDDSGQPVRRVGVNLDITERKRAAELRSHLAAIVESSADAIVGVALDGKVVSWNSGAERVFGYKAEEMVGRPISLLAPSKSADQILRRLEGLRQGERIVPYETERIRKDGRRIEVSVTISPIRDSTGRVIGAAGIARDITERKRAEASLRESEERFRNMADTAPVMIWVCGPDKRMTFVSRAWLDFTGRSLEQELGNGWLEGVHPDDRKRNSASFSSAFDASQNFRMEGRLRRADGEYRWVLCNGVPRFEADGAFDGYIGSTIDITDQKYAEAERRRGLDEIAHLNRVGAMGELTASLAHELNQPLAAILSNAQAASRLLSGEPRDLSEVRACLTDIVADDKRAGEVIKRVRALLKKEESCSAAVDLNDVVGDVIRLLQNDAMLRKASVAFEPSPNLPVVLGDRVQLHQVVMNLMVNGLEAAQQLPGDRWLKVRTCRSSGGGVELTVEDSGKGIAESDLARVFEPFFSTKPDGLGMGLSISRSIVQAHSGRLWAENIAGGGALFRCVLPAAQQTAAAAR